MESVHKKDLEKELLLYAPSSNRAGCALPRGELSPSEKSSIISSNESERKCVLRSSANFHRTFYEKVTSMFEIVTLHNYFFE